MRMGLNSARQYGAHSGTLGCDDLEPPTYRSWPCGRVRVGVLPVALLGAVQVRVPGPADRARDGVIPGAGAAELDLPEHGSHPPGAAIAVHRFLLSARSQHRIGVTER